MARGVIGAGLWRLLLLAGCFLPRTTTGLIVPVGTSPEVLLRARLKDAFGGGAASADSIRAALRTSGAVA